jgi:hypothetical protein
MLTLILCLSLVALLEHRRRAKNKAFRDEIDRFMEWGDYDK